jgi:murein DD-endopeptidase MepM/ murein hydrolase activator NlpD
MRVVAGLAAAAFAAVGAGLYGLLVLVAMVPVALLQDEACAGIDPLHVAQVQIAPAAASLDATQVQNAATVVAVGQQMQVPAQGIVIALAAAAIESRFLVYANDGHGNDLAPDQYGIARSLALSHDAVGSDHGSLGVFQQQWPWWGSMSELMDPVASARLFYEALLRVPGWASMNVGLAAQAVQRSAFPSRYATAEPLARTLFRALADDEGSALPATCGFPVEASPDGWTGPLPAGTYTVSSGYGSRFHPILRIWKLHSGLDLAAPAGTPVRSVGAGTVTFAGSAGGYGNLVVVDHGQVETAYAHLSVISATVGDRVSAGAVVGRVGSTGYSTGNHLHFEVRLPAGTTDPVPWLRQRGIRIGVAA